MYRKIGYIMAALLLFTGFAGAYEPTRDTGLWIGTEAQQPTGMAAGDFGVNGHIYKPAGFLAYDHWENLPAKSTSAVSGAGGIIIDTTTLASGTSVFVLSEFTQPPVPRGISFRYVYGDMDVVNGTVTATVALTITGTDIKDEAITETLTSTAPANNNAATGYMVRYSTNAYKTITGGSAVLSTTCSDFGTDGALTARIKILIGNSDVIGFQRPLALTAGSLTKAAETYVNQLTTTYELNPAKNTWKPTNAPNGTIDFDLWYRAIIE